MESRGGCVLSPDKLNDVQFVRELLTVVQKVGKPKRIADEPKAKGNKEDELFVPSIVKNLGNQVIDFAQRTLYEKILETNIQGRSNVPPHTNFIVCSNHASHLDMGLIKFAIGEKTAKQTVAVAAADYGSTQNTNALI